MRPIVMDLKSPPVPRRVTSKRQARPAPPPPRIQTTIPTRKTYSSIYERAKRQQAARELKVECLRKELTSDCTFTPKTLSSSSASRRREPGTPRSTEDSVFMRLYRKSNSSAAVNRVSAEKAGRPSKTQQHEPSPHSSPSVSATPPNGCLQNISHRLENLYEEGVVKLLQRPRSDRDEKLIRDERYETKQLQESRAKRQVYPEMKRSSLRMVPKLPKPVARTPAGTAAAIRRQTAANAACSNIRDGFKTPSPRRPLSPPTKQRSSGHNLLFPSEIIVDMMTTGSSSPHGIILPRRSTMLPRRLMQSPESWPSSGASSNPWRTPSPVSRKLPHDSKKMSSSRSKSGYWQQSQTPSPQVWKSEHPKPWHTPLRKDYSWAPSPLQADDPAAALAVSTLGRPDITIFESPERRAKENELDGTASETDEIATEYGSI